MKIIYCALIFISLYITTYNALASTCADSLKANTELALRDGDPKPLIKCAEQGDMLSQRNLAEMYMHGMGGVTKNIKQAQHWFYMAGKKGDLYSKREAERLDLPKWFIPVIIMIIPFVGMIGGKYVGAIAAYGRVPTIMEMINYTDPVKSVRILFFLSRLAIVSGAISLFYIYVK